jgi:hypothetical protein
MRKTRHFACCAAAVLLISATVAHAEYCLNYSSGVKSLARQSGSSSSRGCVATEQECKAALISNASSYSGSCYYVPGLYPPTQGAASGGTSSSIDQAARANDSAQKKIRAQQQAEEQAAQRAAQEVSQGLLHEIRGVESSSGLTIKMPTTQPAGKARAQLDCVQRASSSSKREAAARLGPDASVRGGQDDFENAEDCRPVSSNVPEVSAPVPVADELPRDPALRARLLDSLLVRQRDMRRQLVSQDRDIAKLEAEVKRAEQVPKVDVRTAPMESDALRRAREALAKARADRQKTALEYDKLQQQAQAARERQATP